MKIGMVSEFYYPKPGGISEHIRSLSRELASIGHEVVVITGRREGAILEPGPRVETLGRSIEIPYNGSLSTITAGRGLRSSMRALIRKERFDIVHVHNPLMPTLPLLALSTAEVPVVATLHSSYPRDFWVELFHAQLERLWSRIRTVIPVSPAAHHSVSGRFRAGFRIVPNGVDFAEIQSVCRRIRFEQRMRPGDVRDRTEVGQRAREDRHLEGGGAWLPSRTGASRILFVGASVPRKGLSILVQAFTLLRRMGTEAELIVVGDGPGTRGAAGMVPGPLRHDVHFLGSLPRRGLLECYAACDLFCAPSLGRESFGMVLLEAMAAGLPVVASDIDGYRDVVSQGEEGILVPPGDSEALAEAIASLLSSAEERRTYGERGRTKAAGFAWPIVARQIEAVYSDSLGLPAPIGPLSIMGDSEETVALLQQATAGVADGP